MLPVNAAAFSVSELSEHVRDARQRLLDLVVDLDDEAMAVPYRTIVNPFLWEMGHIAWFQEHWVLRHVAGHDALVARAAEFYNSSTVAHTTRWKLDLPSRQETLDYLARTRDGVLERLEKSPDDNEIYFVLLALFHEDMHTEAFTYMRQTMEYPMPTFCGLPTDVAGGVVEGSSLARRRDVDVPGGTWMLGATRDDPFVFDNEKWAHPVELAPFSISPEAVSQGEFAAFVDAGGYETESFWSCGGWQWRQEAGAAHPVSWRRENGNWRRRHFDRWGVLEPTLPVVHVNWHEARAYCRWAGRRLPTEAEWDAAASAAPAVSGGLSSARRRFPWPDPSDDDTASSSRANLDWHASGCVDVSSLAAGDSAAGCRQMIGNVWEWTDSDFLPFSGFEPDPYLDYSKPWFGTRKVLRGGCWATRSRLISNNYRNFFTPDRRDVFAGFRTCALCGQ